MISRFALLLLLCLPFAPAQAQDSAPTQPAAAPKPATVRVSLQTSLGAILIELEKERAPLTTANFLRYIDQKRMDGANFYRATKVGEGFGLIQGGTRNDPKRTLAAIAHEPTSQTGLSHVDGAIAMARNAPGSATGDFFITVGAFPTMDADPSQPGDNLGFAVFGRVVEGMDVVRAILAAPTSPTEGEGVMKGQMLSPPVRIITARRAE
jgi:peptidyl-prolyl cis-trans isomerase A (cyclophilin A)